MQKKNSFVLGTILMFMLLGAGFLQAQVNNDNPRSTKNNQAIRVDNQIAVSGGERTDIVFTRSFLLGMADDSLAFENSRSGVYSFGLSYGLPIRRVLEIKIEPRATWHKIYFNKTNAPWSPAVTGDTTRIFQKIRSFYIEMPIGIKVKLARNADGKYKMLIEGGFSLGYNTGSTNKTRDEVGDTRVTVKTNKVQDLNRWRYGPYFRLGTNWGSLYGFYRMSDLFESDATYGQAPNRRPYPKFPQLEMGLSITL